MRGLKVNNKRHKFWSQRRRWCAWIGVVAVLFQLAVPLGQGMAASTFANNTNENALPLVICSALGGVAQVADGRGVSAVAGPSDPSDPSRTAGPCVFCFACCQARTFDVNVMPVAEAITVKLKIVSWVYGPHTDNIFVSSRRLIRHLTRAPPSFI